MFCLYFASREHVHLPQLYTVSILIINSIKEYGSDFDLGVILQINLSPASTFQLLRLSNVDNHCLDPPTFTHTYIHVTDARVEFARNGFSRLLVSLKKIVCWELGCQGGNHRFHLTLAAFDKGIRLLKLLRWGKISARGIWP